MTQFEEEIESLVGQFCYAFGAGAGRLRVQRETIATLQARYRPYLQANLRTEAGHRAWADAKFHLLEYVTAMGRYAASLALQAALSGRLADDPEGVEKQPRQAAPAAVDGGVGAVYEEHRRPLTLSPASQRKGFF